MTDPQTLRAEADRILELHETGDLDGALAACGRLLDQVDADDLGDAVVRESTFTARFERAVLHTELGDLEAAARAYAEAAATPTDLDDPDQRHELAMALLNQGICLESLGRVTEALRAYDRLVVQLGDADDPVTADQVVRGRVNRAAAMLSVGRAAEALTVAEGLVGDLDPDDAMDAEQLAMAVRIQARALTELARPGDAAEVLVRLDGISDEEVASRRQIAAGSLERAQLLDGLGDRAGARDVAARVAERFARDDDPEVTQLVGDLERVVADGDEDAAPG